MKFSDLVYTPGGPITFTSLAVNATLTIGYWYQIDTSAARTLTLPLLSSVATGKPIWVIDGSHAAATNNITVSASGTDAILYGGTSGANYVVNVNSSQTVFIASSGGWRAISSNISGDTRYVQSTGLSGSISGLGSSSGILASNGGSAVLRTLTGPAAGITVTNGTGAAGNPTLALANDLSALEALASTGIAVRTGTDAWAQRSIAITGNGISVSNADGSAGNPTLALSTGMSNLAALSWSAGVQLPTLTAANTWALATVGTSSGNILDKASGDALYVALAGSTSTGTQTLVAGTTTVAPLKFQAGAALTTPVAHAVEWNGTNLFITQSTGPTRKTIAYTDSTMSGNTTGSAATLTTPRTIAGSGDVSWTGVAFDGSANITLSSIAIGTNKVLDTMIRQGTAASVIGRSAASTGNVGDIASSADGDVLWRNGTTIGFAALPFAKLGSKPTTLAGYGITDALNIAGGTLTGNLILNADPSTGLGAATKQYVDSVAQGLDPKASVRAASTANVTISGPGTAIDGVTLATNDRVLLKNQSTASQNGIYQFNGSGSAMTRTLDADSWAELPGAHVFVEEGTVNAATGWVCNVIQGGTLGTTNITFVQFSGAGTYTANNGIVLSASNFALTGQALAFHNLATTGLVALTSAGNVAGRTIGVTGSGVSVTNGDGVAGSPSIALSTQLSNLAQVSWTSGTQIPTLTAANTWTLKTVGSSSGNVLDRASGDLLYLPLLGGVLGGTLTLAAGTTSVAPLKFQAGSVQSSPVAHSLEWDGTNLFATQATGPTRKTVAYTDSSMSGNTTGSAATLTTPRTIAGSGDVSWTGVAFDGSANITLSSIAIGTNKVLDTMLRQGTATSVIGRSANSGGNVADIAASADGNVLWRNGTTLAFAALPFSKIGSTPTTLSGYGITDALNIAGGTLTGNLILNADPSSALGAATKQYVDNLVQGLDAKASVKAASSANVNIASPGALTMDGVSIATNDRVLLKAQTTPAQNGIYLYNGSGSAMTRTTDMDTWAEVPGAFAFVEQGSTFGGTGWVCTSAQGGTLGTTAITFVQFSGGGTYTAGTGLTLSGTQFALTGQALAFHNLGTFGLVALTSSGTVASRTLTAPAAGITVSNGDGVAGNPTLALANDLGALEALSTTGYAKRTGTDTWVLQAIQSGDVTGALGYTPVDPANAALTGTPTAPTATAGASTTQIATTAFVSNALNTTGSTMFQIVTSDITLAQANWYGVATTAPRTLTLPLLSGVTIGKCIRVADLTYNANGNNVTVNTSGSDTIQSGGTSGTQEVLDINGFDVWFVATSSGWALVAMIASAQPVSTQRISDDMELMEMMYR